MICKFYLTLGSSVTDTSSPDCIEVSSMISNLMDIEVSFARVDLGGTVRKISIHIDFVEEARERLVELYAREQLRSSASFAVYRIQNDWTYEKFFECPLDFSTFRYDEHTASCGCLDSSAAAVIKAKKSVRYEFPVSEMKEMLPLSYDGMRILNDATFEIIGETIEGDNRRTRVSFDNRVWWWVPRLGMIGSNLINNKSILVADQEEGFQQDGTASGWGFPVNSNVTSCFAECVKDCTVTIDFSTFNVADSSNLGFVLFKISGGSAYPLTCGYSNLSDLYGNTRPESVKWTGRLAAGDKLQYAVFNHDRKNEMGTRSFYVYPQNGQCRWHERSSAVSVDVFTPVRLLDNILRSMSENGERIYGGIKPTAMTLSDARYAEMENTRLNSTLLAAADSIRNIPNAKVSTSFADFCKFMESEFGYVYEIQDKAVSGGTIPDYIAANSFDFRGMTDLHTNITSVDSPNAVIHFSTTDKCFVGVVYESSLQDCSSNFPGFERYQSFADGSYKVHTDRFYHDTVEDVYYTATVGTQTLPDTGSTSWVAELHECSVEVSRGAYVSVRQFGGIISDYETDSGAFAGTFDASKVMYARRKRQFVYSDAGKFYSSFPEGTDYNLSDRARADMIYENAGQKYVILGTSLTKCTVAEGEVVTAPYVYFRHRDELFISKGTHSVRRISGFSYEVSRRIYSQIEIGYNKQDYDIGNNGMDEFNFKSVYTTGTGLNDSKLVLVSPYRADSYGIEELAEKRGEDTTSTGSDGSIFAIMCTKGADSFLPERSVAVTGVSTETMFNAQMSPMYMARANERFLASFAPVLRFASTEGNSACIIGGTAVTSDIALSDPLMGNGDITFETDDFAIPSDWNGYEIEISSCGQQFRGILDSVSLSVAESEVLKYKLIESK